MSIDKVGTPTKIVEITSQSLDELRQKVAKKNNLVRCSGCGHLLGKKDDAILDIQHKKLVIVAEIKDGKVSFKCPECEKITTV